MSASPMPTSMNGRELSRLLSAAVVNQKFCRLLLTNAATAIAAGYNGETFRLGKEDRDLILSIRAKNLADFARQITSIRTGSGRAQRAPVVYT